MMLIDDDEIDHISCRRAVEQSNLVANLIHFYYAEEALAYLKDESNPRVDIIALDINMPGMDGFGFLKAATAELGGYFADAVVMVTTSTAPEDREKAMRYEIVKDYINKPLAVEGIQSMLGLLRLPAQRHAS